MIAQCVYYTITIIVYYDGKGSIASPDILSSTEPPSVAMHLRIFIGEFHVQYASMRKCLKICELQGFFGSDYTGILWHVH